MAVINTHKGTGSGTGEFTLLETDVYRMQIKAADLQEDQYADVNRDGSRPDPPWGAEGAALYAAIGEAIRAARCENELTQAQLAEMVGILRTSIVNIEAGRQRLPIDRLYDIADALGIQATALLPKNEAV